MLRRTIHLLFFLVLLTTIPKKNTANPIDHNKVTLPLLKQDSIKIIGLIYNNRTKIKKYTINIYIRNKLFKSVPSTSRHNFQANVPLNTYCTVEISADGYYTKRFIFDSSVPADYTKRIPEFKFDMDIFSEDEITGVNTSALDMPVGVVTYNNRKDRFEHNKSYTKKMKKVYKDLLVESQLQERMQLTNEE
jgi:hypothetical protein